MAYCFLSKLASSKAAVSCLSIILSVFDSIIPNLSSRFCIIKSFSLFIYFIRIAKTSFPFFSASFISASRIILLSWIWRLSLLSNSSLELSPMEANLFSRFAFSISRSSLSYLSFISAMAFPFSVSRFFLNSISFSELPFISLILSSYSLLTSAISFFLQSAIKSILDLAKSSVIFLIYSAYSSAFFFESSKVLSSLFKRSFTFILFIRFSLDFLKMEI